MSIPAWPTSDLPHPPAWSLGNSARIIGPGALLLGISLGSGEWLLGPLVAARYGPALLWICTASVLLQALLTAEMARYTLATGEPIWSGFMRTRPGAAVWAWVYTALHGLQLGWAGWALAAATTLTAALLGRLPRPEDHTVVLGLGFLLFLGAAAAAALGSRAHAALERAGSVMLMAILGFLLLSSALLVPWNAWTAVGVGFVAPLAGRGHVPGDADWVLLAALAAYSGAGGTINATFTQWLRDKGFGMAGAVGGVPATIGGQRIRLAEEGRLFPLTQPNLQKWRAWWRHVGVGVGWLWTVGPLLAMALPVLLTVTVMAPGTELAGTAAITGLAQALGERRGALLWAATLLAGGWIFWSTQLGALEGFARGATELLWAGSAPVRAWSGGRPHVVYYAALGLFTLGGCLALTLGDPLSLVLIGATVAAVNLVVLSLHTLRVNRALLPRELRPAVWREVGLAACAVFFAALLALVGSRPERLLALFAP